MYVCMLSYAYVCVCIYIKVLQSNTGGRRPQKTRACPGGGRRTIVGVLCLEDPISHIISCISHIISCISHIISCITCVWRNRDMSVRPMCRSDQEPKIPYHLCPFAYTFSEACHFASTTHMLQAVNKTSSSSPSSTWQSLVTSSQSLVTSSHALVTIKPPPPPPPPHGN